MWLPNRFLILILLAAAPALAWQVSLRVQADAECRLTIDGKPAGTLQPGKSIELALEPGSHRLEAATADGAAVWQQTVELDGSGPRTVNVPLVALLERIKAERTGYWTDHATGLTWAAADNGSGVSLSQAEHHCATLLLGGKADWRLPSIDELHRIFGGPASDKGFHVIGPLKLTGWAWSSTAGKEPGEGWALDFGDGGRASVAAGDSGLNRALCVRSERR